MVTTGYSDDMAITVETLPFSIAAKKAQKTNEIDKAGRSRPAESLRRPLDVEALHRQHHQSKGHDTDRLEKQRLPGTCIA